MGRTTKHAIVVGASIAGLCAARVLSDVYDRVTVYERDELPEGPAHRSAVPQDRHVHLLMARGADRVLRVFLNVCRHRGARLIAQQGEVCRRRNFVCPYHAWTYRLDGSLAGVPRAEAFPDLDRHLLGLRELPSTVRHGLIWAKLDPGSDGALDIAGYLGELDRDLDAIGLAHHRFYRQHAVRRATNWKLIVAHSSRSITSRACTLKRSAS